MTTASFRPVLMDSRVEISINFSLINCESMYVGNARGHMLTQTARVSTNRIDCAGILKLRNSDIELRKGETDIGRKNTRVRMVFRVHINQSTGRTVSLQVASNPIECCEYMSSEILGRLSSVLNSASKVELVHLLQSLKGSDDISWRFEMVN